MIHYVCFRDPIAVGGNFGDLKSWQRDKHGKEIECVERGPMIVLTIRGGQRVRVPVSNVVYIRDDGEDPPAKQGKEKL